MNDKYVRLPASVANLMLDMLTSSAYPTADTRWVSCESALREALMDSREFTNSSAVLEEIKHASDKGYEICKTTKYGTRFVKNMRHIWSLQDGWQTADFIGHRFINHEIFATLTEAIDKPL